MEYEQLKLGNQLCFPAYAASRLITREYQPYLDKLGITYPQYIVMMVLWENKEASVNEIARKLILNTNTVTPLLKRMESQGLLIRQRSETDIRKVMVRLTPKGMQMQEEAAHIPEELFAKLKSENITVDELIDLKKKLDLLISVLLEKGKDELPE